jgi:hypothetical protein
VCCRSVRTSDSAKSTQSIRVSPHRQLSRPHRSNTTSSSTANTTAAAQATHTDAVTAFSDTTITASSRSSDVTETAVKDDLQLTELDASDWLDQSLSASTSTTVTIGALLLEIAKLDTFPVRTLKPLNISCIRL